MALSVQKTSGTNTIQVVDDVRKALPRIQKLLPPGVVMLELFDQSLYIRNSIKNLQHEALMGAVLAVLVILVFLRNLRSTMIVSLSIPISIVCAFILLYFNNLTLNTFTLGGLALGVGRLVDDAIVVLENIYRHRSAGDSPQEASIKGSGEVGLAVLASTITTIVVFLPVIFITGIARLLFTPLALTVAFSLIASYFVSLTVIPVLSRKYLHPESEDVLPPSPTSLDRMKWRFKGFFERIDLRYQSLLAWALGHRKTVVIAVVVAFLGSLPLYLFIGTEFFPSMDESQFRFIVQLPVGTRLEEAAKISAHMEEVVRQTIGKEITAVQVNFGIPTGVSAIWSQNTGPHMGWIRVRLIDPGDRELSSDALMEKLRPRLLQEFPGVRIFFVSGGIVRMLISFGYDNPIDVEILGYDFKAGQKLADQVAALIRQTPGAKDVRVSREPDYPQQNIVIDRERAALLGLNVAQVARAIQTFINGYQASIFSDPQTGNQYYITVRSQEADRTSVERPRARSSSLTARDGPSLLDNIANISRGVGPIQIERKYQQRIIHVTANTFGRDLGSVAADIQAKIGQAPASPELQDQPDRSRGKPAGIVHRPAGSLDPGRGACVHGPGVPVQIPYRSLHHHVLRAPGIDRGALGALPDPNQSFGDFLHGRDHDGRNRG